MKTILVATDFSERSDRALRRATLLARQFGADLGLVHVVDDDQPDPIVDTARDQSEALLRQMAMTLREVDGVACDTRVILASPFVGIVAAVEDTAPDLLVIGPHRRQVLRDVFVGTTAERTIRSVACPVLMVNAAPAGNYRHVLQTTDLSDGSAKALRRFAALGIEGETQGSLLHAFDASALRLVMANAMPKHARDRYLADERHDAARDLAGFAASAGLGDLLQIVRHQTTRAPREILEAAQEEQADLIVMSTHGRSGIARVFLGSVTEQVLRTSPIDVIAIPPGRDE